MSLKCSFVVLLTRLDSTQYLSEFGFGVPEEVVRTDLAFVLDDAARVGESASNHAFPRHSLIRTRLLYDHARGISPGNS